MEAVKEKINSWLQYTKDYINSFRFEEKEKNIVYFSKFSLDISEFYLIHEFVKTLKENIFKKNLEQFRYCLKNIIILNKDKILSEKEKVIILFSACLFIYYKKFGFNTNCSFEKYFDNEFINLSKTIFKFEIKNNEFFKIFAFYFFSIIQKEIIALDYSKIKALKTHYNYLLVDNNNEEDDVQIDIINGGSNNISEGFQEQVLTFLISAKEKMIDLVFETSEQNLLNLFPSEINDMNDRFQKLNNNLKCYINLENNEKNENNKKVSDKNINHLNVNKSIDNMSDNKSDMNIEDPSPRKPKSFNFNNNNSFMKTDYSNSNINTINDNSFNNISKYNTINSNNSTHFNNTNSNMNNVALNDSFSPSCFDTIDNSNNKKNININNNNKHSKRIISELIKIKLDNKTMEIIEEVSKIIDEKYLDKFLNNKSKAVTMIQYFCCYLVEFTPDMLQTICPQYKDVIKDFGINFIVLAKELYNTTMEIFSIIYDLSYTNFDAFIDLTKDCGIQLQHAQGLYKIFRDYSIILFNEKKKKGRNNNIMNVLRKLFDEENKNWRGIIQQKANDFTNFYKI